MYDEDLANRTRAMISAHQPFSERKMFGGLCFMVGGNMACGIVGNELMVRTGPTKYEESLLQPHVRPMDFTGKPMTGMLYVGPEGLDDDGLALWVDRALNFAGSLPLRTGGPKTRRAAKPPRA